MTFEQVILSRRCAVCHQLRWEQSFSRCPSSLASLDTNCIATLCLCARKGTYSPPSDDNPNSEESIEQDAFHWLKPFYSESNSFLEIKAKDDVMSCDQEQEVQVDYILSQNKLSSEEDHIDFYYLVSTEDSWFSGQGYAYWHFTLFSQHRDHNTQMRSEILKHRGTKATPTQSVCDFCSAQTFTCFPVPGPAPSPQLRCFVIHVLTSAWVIDALLYVHMHGSGGLARTLPRRCAPDVHLCLGQSFWELAGNLWGSWHPSTHIFAGKSLKGPCTGPWCTPEVCKSVLMKSTFKKMSQSKGMTAARRRGYGCLGYWIHLYNQKVLYPSNAKIRGHWVLRAAAHSFRNTSGFASSPTFLWHNQHPSSLTQLYHQHLCCRTLETMPCPRNFWGNICQMSFSFLVFFLHSHALRIQSLEWCFCLLFRW